MSVCIRSAKSYIARGLASTSRSTWLGPVRSRRPEKLGEGRSLAAKRNTGKKHLIEPCCSKIKLSERASAAVSNLLGKKGCTSCIQNLQLTALDFARTQACESLPRFALDGNQRNPSICAGCVGDQGGLTQTLGFLSHASVFLPLPRIRLHELVRKKAARKHRSVLPATTMTSGWFMLVRAKGGWSCD